MGAATSSYAPGTRPKAPGFFVAYNEPADELALRLEAEATKPPPPKPPPPPGRALRWLLAGVFIALGAAGWAIDRHLEFHAGLFASFLPVAWLGAGLVFALGRGGSGGTSAYKPGCGTFILVGLLLAAGVLYATVPAVATWIVPGVAGTVIVLLFGRSMDRRDRPAPPLKLPRDRIQACADIVAALADDAAPGKPATGWLDLTGAEQEGKVLRKAKAASGAEIRIYRDEWWRLRLPLRDGSQLRLAGVERRKARGEYWKQGARRRKLKPGRSESLHTVEVRLQPSPQFWRVKAGGPGKIQIAGVVAAPVAAADGTLSVVVQPKSPDWFKPREVLALVVFLQRQLERVTPGA